MTDDPRLEQFAQYTPEQALTPGYGDAYIFFVGRDDVHSIFLRATVQEQLGLKGNMYGYDDAELNDAIMAKFSLPHVLVQWTLDSSEAGGVHEQKLIAADRAHDPVDFNNSFAIGQSPTHRISHTKSVAYLGQGIFIEGSTNWSADGEGIGISLKADVKNPKGFHAQNNTIIVSTNPVAMARLCARLDAEHMAALQQQAAKGAK